MAEIQTILEQILKARYGKDVRQSIHDGIKQCYVDMDNYSDFPEFFEGNLKNLLESTNSILKSVDVSKKIISYDEELDSSVLNNISKGNILTDASFANNYWVYKYDVTAYIGQILFIDGSATRGNLVYCLKDAGENVLQAEASTNEEYHKTTKRLWPIYIQEDSKYLYVSKSLDTVENVYTISSVDSDSNFNDFASTLSEYEWAEIPLTATDNRILTIYGTVRGNVKPVGDSYKVSNEFLVSGLDKLLITSSANYDNVSVVFLDKDLEVISYLNQGDNSPTIQEMNDEVVDVPSNAMYCIVASALLDKVFKVSKKVPKIANKGATIQPFTPTEKYASSVISRTGYVASLSSTTPAYEVHDFKRSELPDTIYVTAGSNYTNAAYAYIDEDGTPTYVGSVASGDRTGISVENLELRPPESVDIVRIANNPFKQSRCYITKYPIRYSGKWENKKWIAFGDSLTDYNQRTLSHYFDYIKEQTGITVLNYGVSGTGYKRKHDEDLSFYQRISEIDEDFDVITIFGSGNDLGAGVELGTSSDAGTDTLCGAINTTIDNLFKKYPLANLGIVTPTPWDGYKPGNNNSMEKYSNAIVEICKNRGIPCLDLYHCSGLRPWDAEYKKLAYSKDEGGGTHPDETGHAVIAPRFEAFLDSLLLH